MGFARSQLLLCNMLCIGRKHLRSEGIINAVIEKAKPVIEKTLSALGYELVDIEYKTQYGEKHLTVFIANEDGITLADCERVSNALDSALDELDPTDSAPYCLDISSPGLDRPFKTQRDFERNYGEPVEVKLYAPYPGTKNKQLVGTLVSRDGESLVLEIDGSEVTVQNSTVALVRPYVEF